MTITRPNCIYLDFCDHPSDCGGCYYHRHQVRSSLVVFNFKERNRRSWKKNIMDDAKERKVSKIRRELGVNKHSAEALLKGNERIPINQLIQHAARRRR